MNEEQMIAEIRSKLANSFVGWTEYERSRMPRFIDQFDVHVRQYCKTYGVELSVVFDAVNLVANGQFESVANRLFVHFREYLQECLAGSNPGPVDSRKSPTYVPGHGTFPGSYESGKKR